MGRANAATTAIRRIARVASLLAISLSAAAPSWAQTLTDPSLQLETWATGLTRPTQVAFLERDDLLVTEYTAGRVRRVKDGVVEPTSAFELTSFGTGILGIAIHHATPKEVFLYIEDATETFGNRVNRYTWNATLGVLQNEALVHQFPPGPMGSIHDAGVMAIGPASEAGAGAPYLYVAAGDRQQNGQLQNNPAGAPPDDAGVILRIERDGQAAPGNPFTPYCSSTTMTTCTDDGDCPGAETCIDEVAKYYAYGIRNHFGLDFDPVTGHLWDTENGDTDWDEVNLVTPGMNSGWTPLQGPGDPGSVTLFDMPGASSTYSDPEFAWLLPTGPTSIAFPYGSRLGVTYDDVVIFGDFNAPGRLYALPLDASRTGLDFSAWPNLLDGTADTSAELDQLVFGTDFGSILEVKMSPDGALFVASYFTGVIYKISGFGRIPAVGVPGLLLLAAGLVGAAAGIGTLRGRG